MMRCPKCKSTNVEKERMPTGEQSGDMVCNACGETGWRGSFLTAESKATHDKIPTLPGCSHPVVPAEKPDEGTTFDGGPIPTVTVPEAIARLLGNSSTAIRVARFAVAMEAKLEQNRHKGAGPEGWRSMPPRDLVRRMYDEIMEVIEAVGSKGLDGNVHAIRCGTDAGVVLDECADIGNFAMMLADAYSFTQNPEA